MIPNTAIAHIRLFSRAMIGNEKLGSTARRRSLLPSQVISGHWKISLSCTRAVPLEGSGLSCEEAAITAEKPHRKVRPVSPT